MASGASPNMLKASARTEHAIRPIPIMKHFPLSCLMAVLLPVAAAAAKQKPPPVQQVEPGKPKAPAAQPDKQPAVKPDAAPAKPVPPEVTAGGINGMIIEAAK